MVDRSEPQMPARCGFTRAQPGRSGTTGSLSVDRRRAANGPEMSPGARLPSVRAPTYLGALRKYSIARLLIWCRPPWALALALALRVQLSPLRSGRRHLSLTRAVVPHTGT